MDEEEEESAIFFMNMSSSDPLPGSMNIGNQALWRHLTEEEYLPYCRICSTRMKLDDWFTVQTVQTIKLPGNGTTLIGQFDVYFECLEHGN